MQSAERSKPSIRLKVPTNGAFHAKSTTFEPEHFSHF